MAPLGNVSVVSAAIIEGSLILGLSDGSIINCGYVQGPQGLKGDPGPTGATGDPGRDGNTIHTVAGTPRNDMGQDGDYAIDNINWRIYGPKSAGVWGNANDMLPSKDNLIVNGRGFEGGVGGSGDTGGGGGGGTGYIKSLTGDNGIVASPQANPQTWDIDADIDENRGLEFVAKKIAINLGTGLEFDAATGALKTDFDISEYAKTDYVDAQDSALSARIDANLADIGSLQDDVTDLQTDLGQLDSETVKKTEFEADQQRQDGEIDALEISSQNLQLQIDELGITKGKVARYEVKNTIGTPVSRPGELSVNNPYWPNTSIVSFGIEDLDGVLTKPMANGDIIDFVDSATENLSRYKIIDASGAPTAVSIEYVSGNADFAVGQEKQVYIYPQNEAGATKEYVDDQDALLQGQIDDNKADINLKADATDLDTKVSKSGDTATGYLDFNSPSNAAGARWYYGGDKALSIWSYSGVADQIRVRCEPNNSLNFTGYPNGGAEKRYLYWDGKNNAGLSIHFLNDPVEARDALSLGYADGRYLNLAGGTLDGELLFSGGDPNNNLSIYPNRGNDDSSITALNGSSLRFRTSPTNDRGDTGKKTHMSMGVNDLGEPVTNIYHLAEPTEDDQPATRAYVDQQAGGGVPVGSIMIWMNSNAPAGWFKLQGGTFDTNANPQLHAYLQSTTGYVAGNLPDWSGRYPGEYGDHIANPLGSKQNQKTAKPSGGAPKSGNSIPDGTTRTFNGAGNTNAYSNGTSKATISDGWDSVTRPPTVVVHYIIKHD